MKCTRDFLGGWDKMVEKSFELMNRTFDTKNYEFSGGYDFRFKVQGHSDYEEDNILLVDCPIESDGKVDLIMNQFGGGNGFYYHLTAYEPLKKPRSQTQFGNEITERSNV